MQFVLYYFVLVLAFRSISYIMKKREEMLVITMEECGELIQACSKMILVKAKQNIREIYKMK